MVMGMHACMHGVLPTALPCQPLGQPAMDRAAKMLVAELRQVVQGVQVWGWADEWL